MCTLINKLINFIWTAAAYRQFAHRVQTPTKHPIDKTHRHVLNSKLNHHHTQHEQSPHPKLPIFPHPHPSTVQKKSLRISATRIIMQGGCLYSMGVYMGSCRVTLVQFHTVMGTAMVHRLTSAGIGHTWPHLTVRSNVVLKIAVRPANFKVHVAVAGLRMVDVVGGGGGWFLFYMLMRWVFLLLLVKMGSLRLGDLVFDKEW